ncbi:MAG TPA: ABC transporter permease [Thermoanaerobaculia bacterium]|jgi:ABC-2 type transport system permease protein|nr:ABC transporter permease [Thermoanaerobaculia bacterium]
MRVLTLLVAKDLRRRFRAPLGLLIVLSFPVVFALLIALSFGSRGERVPKIRLLVENQDEGMAANVIMSALTSKQMAAYVDVEVVGAEGRGRIEKGEASALLRIPQGFTQNVLDGKPASLALVRNPAEGILPEIAEQLTRVLVDVLDAGSHVLREPLQEIRSTRQSQTGAVTDEAVIRISLGVKRSLESGFRYLSPPVIAVDTASLSPQPADEKSRKSGSGTSLIFLVVLPGVSVYALFLVGDQAMRDIITEATAGTLRRQLAGPIGTGTLVLGKALYTIVLALLALLVLSAVGAAVLRRGVDPAGFLLLSFALVLAVTGTAATIYGLARDERRGATIGSIVYLILGFAGGSFVNLEGLPRAVRAAAPASPFYWGTAGYRKLIESSGGLGDVLPNIAILAGLGVFLLALGALLLHRTLRRGGLA